MDFILSNPKVIFFSCLQAIEKHRVFSPLPTKTVSLKVEIRPSEPQSQNGVSSQQRDALSTIDEIVEAEKPKNKIDVQTKICVEKNVEKPSLQNRRKRRSLKSCCHDTSETRDQDPNLQWRRRRRCRQRRTGNASTWMWPPRLTFQREQKFSQNGWKGLKSDIGQVMDLNTNTTRR